MEALLCVASCVRLHRKWDKNPGHIKGLIYKMFLRAAGYISVNFQSCSLFWLFQYLTIQEVLYCYLFLMWKHNFCIRERSLRAATIITSVGFFWFFLLVGSLWGFRLMNIQIQSDWTGSDVINWPMARTYSIYFIVSVRINQVPTMGQDL